MFQTDAGWEEYYDYIFPDDESAQPNLKLLAMAKMWKKQTEEASHNVDDDAADGLQLLCNFTAFASFGRGALFSFLATFYSKCS